MSDSEFVDQARILYGRLSKAVFAFSGDRSLAEDSAQEALLKAWERIEAGEQLRSMEAWTMSVAFNWCRSQLRRHSAGRRAIDKMRHNTRGVSGEAVSSPGMNVLTDEVRAAVLRLPDRQRQVVVLHYLLDLGLAEIAVAAEISEGAVKNALFNGRNALRASLGGPEPQEASVSDELEES